jgi:serine/threonine protein phosphatase PrpC
MKIYSYSLQGRRNSNEDTHIIINNLLGTDKKKYPVDFLAVFDGHGGKIVSKYLKYNLPEFFTKKSSDNIYLKSHSYLVKHFTKVFDNIQNKLINDHPRASNTCGSTACISIYYIDNNNKHKLWVLNVGDSRIIKCNKSYIAEQLSVDHKPSYSKERERIEQLGGKIEFDGVDWRIKDLSLSRAIGDLDSKPYVSHLPEIYKYNISNNDKFLIIACDGLWDIISNQDAIDFVKNLFNQKFTGNIAKELAEYAYYRGSLDNITILLYIF